MRVGGNPHTIMYIYKNNVTRNKALSATGYQELKTYIRGIEIEGHIEKQTKKDEKQP
jgi:hypothetical protein